MRYNKKLNNSKDQKKSVMNFFRKKTYDNEQKNAKTGAGLRANPAFGLGPKAAPRPSHGQARKALIMCLLELLFKEEQVREKVP